MSDFSFRGPTVNVSSQTASQAAEVEDLSEASMHILAPVGGTATIQPEISLDQVNFVPFGSPIAASALPASVALEGPNGMPLALNQVRIDVTAYTSGEYNFVVGGLRRPRH